MAALDFPSTIRGQNTGTQYTGDNGVTYVWDGYKWLGRSPTLLPGTNSLSNGGNTVQVDELGNLVTPSFTLPNDAGVPGQVLKWPLDGSTLVWASDNNSGGGGNLPYTLTSSTAVVSLDSNGTIEYPGQIRQGYQDSTQCPAGVDTVIYTATTQWQHAIKLFVMVEGTPTDGTSWETQACDIIAVKGFVNDIVHVTVYGVTYSSAGTLATFDGQWNATTSRIEITCRPTSLTNSVTTSVHAIEMSTND